MARPPSKTKRRPLLEARTTVSLEQAAYDALADIAYERRISIGCVVREAVANYIGDLASQPSESAEMGRKR